MVTLRSTVCVRRAGADEPAERGEASQFVMKKLRNFGVHLAIAFQRVTAVKEFILDWYANAFVCFVCLDGMRLKT
jgi:hypothetical protein